MYIQSFECVIYTQQLANGFRLSRVPIFAAQWRYEAARQGIIGVLVTVWVWDIPSIPALHDDIYCMGRSCANAECARAQYEYDHEHPLHAEVFPQFVGDHDG